ncbi:MAG TPA: glycosyltransferase family 4 protein [Candidatus Limnocylindrales bacterium]|nr:glycosyltransferase family 4 protein [Candidatus Limnocylindrales bacterium]
MASFPRRVDLALLGAFEALPRALQLAIARPTAGGFERAVRRFPTNPWMPQLAVSLRRAAGPPDRAARLARQLGTSPRTAAHARRQLARLSLRYGLTDTAVAILAMIPESRQPEFEMVRASQAVDDGRYDDARGHADTALRGGHPDAARYLEMIASRVAVLEPGWTPDLGAAGAALTGLRGSAIRGRILHVVSRALPYHQVGYTMRSQSIGEAQLAAGLDARFATIGNFPANVGVPDAPRDWEVRGVPYHRLAPEFSDNGFHDRVVTTSARCLAELVERIRPAVLHPASNHLQAQVALAVARPLGIPVVYEVRGFIEETWASHPERDEDAARASERFQAVRDTETRVMAASDAVVTLSETMRLEIIARGCAPDAVVVIPNAVDVEQFRPMPRDDALAARLGIGDEPVIGYISTFTAYEGIRYLLDAAAALRSRGRRFRLLLVGDGRDRNALVEQGHRLGLDDGTLVMPGRVPNDEIRRYYSVIDIFVVPRTADRVSTLVTPLKPFEAMAMERALVVSDVPPLREIVTPGEAGRLFRPEDAADLAAVLDGLLDDEALRARLGRQARDWVVAERTWAQNGARYRALYERLGAL